MSVHHHTIEKAEARFWLEDVPGLDRTSPAVRATPTDAAESSIVARGRLADARKWFAYKGWDVLRDDERGRRILRLGIDHAWLACPANPVRSVRRWCRRWAPWLSDAELDSLIDAARKRGKFWTPDQCAVTLGGITVADRKALGLRRIGACDDDDGEKRAALTRQKTAERVRAWRAANGVTPRAEYEANSLSKTKPWEAEGISRRTYERRRKATSIGGDDASPLRPLCFSKTLRTCDTTPAVPDLPQAKTEIGATKPPAVASGTSTPKSIVGRVDGAAIVGGPIRQYKTRFPTSMRLTKEMMAYAAAAAFESDETQRMFEVFRNVNIGDRNYSADWDQVWFNWVDRQVDINSEASNRARAEAYWAAA